MSDSDALRRQVAADVRTGLTRQPRSLPPYLFYDAAGSRLFDQITTLPEYYLTRCEREIFEHHASDIAAKAGGDLAVLELGAGTATKTLLLLKALARQQPRLTFYAADLSTEALRLAHTMLSAELPAVDVHAIEEDHSQALAEFREVAGRKLVMFIGSSIGNYDAAASVSLLREIRSALAPGDALLLGTDLVKDPALLVAAYDDSQGVTAAFNRNILARLNHELGAHFVPTRFRHVAQWNEEFSRIEIYLESVVAQRVRVAQLDLNVAFEAGERIHTENCHKFTLAGVDTLLESAGFMRESTWTDDRGWFAEHLGRAA